MKKDPEAEEVECCSCGVIFETTDYTRDYCDSCTIEQTMNDDIYKEE